MATRSSQCIRRDIFDYAIHAHKMGLSIPAIQADCRNYRNTPVSEAELIQTLKADGQQVPRLQYSIASEPEKRFELFALEAGMDFGHLLGRYRERGFPLLENGAQRLAMNFYTAFETAQAKIRNANAAEWDLVDFVTYVKEMGYTKHEIISLYLKRLPKELSRPIWEWHQDVALQVLPADKWMDEIAQNYIICATHLGMPSTEILFELRVHGYNVLNEDYIRVVLNLYFRGVVKIERT